MLGKLTTKRETTKRFSLLSVHTAFLLVSEVGGAAAAARCGAGGLLDALGDRILGGQLVVVERFALFTLIRGTSWIENRCVKVRT